MEPSKKSWRDILRAAMLGENIPPEVIKTYMSEVQKSRKIQPTRNPTMANRNYSRTVLMAERDIAIKQTIFNALDQGGIDHKQLVKLVAMNHGAQLSMDGETFKHAQMHYRQVCQQVRIALIRIQRESRL